MTFMGYEKAVTFILILMLMMSIFSWKKNFRAPGENRIRHPPNTRSDVLTTESPGL